MSKTDLRIKKTKMMIERGFVSCIKKQTFSKITVLDLTDAMMINKSTFYKYYKDKYDLRQHFIDSTLENFSQRLDLSFMNKNYDLKRYEADLPKALLPIYHHREWLKVMWSPNLEDEVFTKMQTIFAEKFKENVYSVDNELTVFHQLQANLFASSAMQVILWWIETNPSAPVDEIANIITRCLSTGFYYAFEKRTKL